MPGITPRPGFTRMAMLSCSEGHGSGGGGIDLMLLTWAEEASRRGFDVSFCTLSGHTGGPAEGPSDMTSGVYYMPGESFPRRVFRNIDEFAAFVETVDAVSVHQWHDHVTHPDKTMLMLHGGIGACYPEAFPHMLAPFQRPLFEGRTAPRGHTPGSLTLDQVLPGLRRPAVLSAVSHFAADTVTEVSGRECRVLYAPIDPCFFRQKPRHRRDVVAYIGRLTHDKGAGVLLEAVRKGGFGPLTLELTDFSSEGEVTDEIRRMAEDGSSVRLVPPLRSRTELADYMASVSVVVLPSLYEGYGMASAEAQAAGTVVVASDVDGLPEACAAVPSPTRLLFTPGDPEDLIRQVEAARGLQVPLHERMVLEAERSVEKTTSDYLEAMAEAARA